MEDDGKGDTNIVGELEPVPNCLKNIGRIKDQSQNRDYVEHSIDKIG